MSGFEKIDYTDGASASHEPSGTKAVMSNRDRSRHDLANRLSVVISEACAEYVRRQKAGRSASMNGALEYIDLRVADEALKWFEADCGVKF